MFILLLMVTHIIIMQQEQQQYYSLTLWFTKITKKLKIHEKKAGRFDLTEVIFN